MTISACHMHVDDSSETWTFLSIAEKRALWVHARAQFVFQAQARRGGINCDECIDFMTLSFLRRTKAI